MNPQNFYSINFDNDNFSNQCGRIKCDNREKR